jgi:dipeptidyl aminopeptidase/acylaminoacyl peptidase
MFAAEQPKRRALCSAGLVALMSLSVVSAAQGAGQELRRFSVADDIELTRFNSSETSPITFSPDGRLFAVTSERGRLDLNQSESSLRIYRTRDARKFITLPGGVGDLSPFWMVTKSTYKNGPIISHVRWLADSSAVAFLAKSASGNDQLFLADIQTKSLEPLTQGDEDVTAFDIRSSTHFVYCVLSPSVRRSAAEEQRATAIVGTGRTLESLLFPELTTSTSVWVYDLSELWAVLDGRRFRVMDTSSAQPVPIHLEGQRALALSPDGHSVVTALTVGVVPPEWETLYPPPPASAAYRIRAGRQNPNGFAGQRDVSEYVLIDLSNGEIKPLARAPLGNTVGWWGLSRADWSHDNRSVVLSDTFVPPKPQDITGEAHQPCVAVADIITGQLDCVERLEVQPPREGRQFIDDVRFGGVGGNLLTIFYFGVDGATSGSRTYRKLADGSWVADAAIRDSISGREIDVSLKQGVNEPPVLIATDKERPEGSHIIWDPNPQLKRIRMGVVSIFRWKDKTGRDWVGGLYKPPDYVRERRYPLIIQTHGFAPQEFRPSGASTTAFAAQELAAVGFLVLQISDCPIRNTPEEGPCQVAGYESAVDRLSMDGLIDPNRIGIIGFSRTCFYVLEALTSSTVQFKAASITDGVNMGYLQYILNIDAGGNSVAHEGDATIGAAPFGVGLQRWLEYSPVFRLDKVMTPIQIVATRGQILQMWEPYAALRYLQRPVDLTILNSDEHVFTNPSVRLISQGGTVDWFRFWLQGYEDPCPAKSEQYKRWRALREQTQAH